MQIKWLISGFFNRAMVIIRSPYEAIKSEFARKKGREHHTFQVTDGFFNDTGLAIQLKITSELSFS